jgi:hypothetical protein
MGIRAMLVRALSPQAEAFYLGFGLESSPLNPMSPMITLEDLRAAA